MNDEYFDAMRQSLKMSGMSDEQIEAMIQMQKAAMQMMPDMSAMQEAAAGAQAAAMNAFGAMLDGDDDDDEFMELVEEPSINPSYQWAVACGANLALINGFYLNDLPTSLDAEDAGYILERDWGIESHDEFMEMAESLKAGRHSIKYNKVAANLDTDKSSTADNIREALERFNDDGLLRQVPDMLAWDLVRLINITRLAFDAGLISREEALGLLKDCAAPLQKTYKSWEELSLAYQFARCAWGGLDEDEYEGMAEGMRLMLYDAESPWQKLDFSMKLDFSK